MVKKYLPILLLLTVLIYSGQTMAKPELTVSPEKFDFGYSPYNVKISHNFWLYSTGDEAVKIDKVITGCGCTKAPLTKNIIPPGDSAQLEIIFNTNKYKNRVVKSPKIISNASEQSVTFITNVQKDPNPSIPILIEPLAIDLSLPQYDLAEEISFVLKNQTDKTLRVSLISYPEEFFEVTLPKKIKSGKSAEGYIKIKANDLNDKIQKSFTFELDDEENTRITVPISRSNPKQLSLKKH
jgi:hypothetical protein